MSAVATTIYPVPVRELVEFALRTGNLGGERDFVGPSRALAGLRGHQRIQRSRPAAYEKEILLSYDVRSPDLILRIQGRIDGLLVTPEQVLLEEIKTVQGSWDGAPEPLHWAQAKIYAFIYAQDHALQTITIQLTYLNLDTDESTEFREHFTAADLTSFFQNTTAVYVDWIQERQEWCRQRDRSIQGLGFPFPSYRPGQRELAVAAYRTLARGGHLFLEAPTGIGKTLAVLFPALKAMAEGKVNRLFYLTARTVGRAVAEKALDDLRQAGLRLRTVTLTAKEKVCVQEGHPCDPSTCPLALGYYDRRKTALRDALHQERVTRPLLEQLSRHHQVCPFELSLDLSLWVDAIVCDYNYVFDPKVYLRRHFANGSGDLAFLIDEAHNLVDRARDMFSADLQTREIQETRRAIKDALPRCAKSLARLNTALRKLCGLSTTSAESESPAGLPGELDLFPQQSQPPRGSASQATTQSQPEIRPPPSSLLSCRELPANLLPLLDDALKESESWLARNQPAEFREDLLQLYFRLHGFRRTAELYDERYVTLIEPGRSVRVRLFCLDPSFLLGQALERGKAALFFSATLTPTDYYQTVLGCCPDTPPLQLPSPFPKGNLAVLVQDRIRTDLKGRQDSLSGVAEAIGAVVQGRPGNYLVYLPSYQYLAAVQDRFQATHPTVATLAQQPGMTESQREAFLEAFAADRKETLVGFAVLGGVFGEGIDLVGERLIGAVIVGVGLPQLCPERNQIRDYFQTTTRSGFDYAYTFPGMNRVLQAIGRIIRTHTDRGVVLLIDIRYAQPRYRNLFPRWWQPIPVRNVRDIQITLHQFWAQEKGSEPPP